MRINELQNFLLVGGTALSLYYGHRLSVDLDLFSTTEFENESLIKQLEKNFPGFRYSSSNIVGIFGFIDDVKIDLIRQHQFTLIDKPVIEDDLRLISIPDIAAMKINAVMKRGVKKDFWDIAELLLHYSLAELISFYQAKYPGQQLLISVPQAIIYFNDAEESEDPVALKGQTWESVKKFIQNKVRSFLS